jgi:hypothetical protein
MPKTIPAAANLREQAKLYEQMAREAATDAVAELFREMAQECLGAAADAEAPEKFEGLSKK